MEIDHHWEEDLFCRTVTPCKPANTVLIEVFAKQNGKVCTKMPIGVISLKYKTSKSKMPHEVKGWGILEYAARALRDSHGLLLYQSPKGGLTVKKINKTGVKK